MNAQLKLLVELQAVDDLIARLKERLAEIPRKIDSLRSGYQKEQKTLEDVKAASEALGKERRTAERELETHEEKIRKLKEQQFMVKTNKEYQTFLHEITVMEEKKGDLEERIITMMDSAAEMEKKIKSQEALLVREKEHFSLEEGKLQEEQGRLEAEMARAQEQRAGIVKNVEGENLKSYRRLMEFHKGKAVVQIVEGICQGCFLGLRPQKFQEVKKGEEIMSCDDCKRIIYQQEGAVEKQPSPAPES